MDVPERLSVCADSSVPARLVARLRRAGVTVHTASEGGVRQETATALSQWAEGLGAALLSLDQRLWNDQRHPLARSTGIIVLKFTPGRLDEAEEAFHNVQQTFGGAYRPASWKGVKILATPLTCLFKMFATDGTVVAQTVERGHGRAGADRPGLAKGTVRRREAVHTAV